MGSVFGGFLRAAGHQVTLLGRRWHLDAIAARGLHIDGIWGEHQVDGFALASRAGDLGGPYHLILVSVKAYDTAEIVQTVSPYLDPEGLAVSIQNGLGNVETLAATLGAPRALGSSVHVGATIPEPGRVTVTVQAAPVVIGPLDPSSDPSMERARYWVSQLNQASIQCVLTDRIQSYLWAKVFYNAPLNALGALLDVHYGALGEDPELRAIMDQIIEEAFTVARGEQVELPWRSANDYRELFYRELLPATAVHRSSMLRDLERGRRTEIQAINGQIWRRGSQLGAPTPFNELMTRLIAWRERNA